MHPLSPYRLLSPIHSTSSLCLRTLRMKQKTHSPNHILIFILIPIPIHMHFHWQTFVFSNLWFSSVHFSYPLPPSFILLTWNRFQVELLLHPFFFSLVFSFPTYSNYNHIYAYTLVVSLTVSHWCYHRLKQLLSNVSSHHGLLDMSAKGLWEFGKIVGSILVQGIIRIRFQK